MTIDDPDVLRLQRAGLNAEGRPVLAIAGAVGRHLEADGRFRSTWRFVWARLGKNGGALFSDREKGLFAPDPAFPRFVIPAGTYPENHPSAGVLIRCRVPRRRYRPGPYVVFKAPWHPIAPRFKKAH